MKFGQRGAGALLRAAAAAKAAYGLFGRSRTVARTRSRFPYPGRTRTARKLRRRFASKLSTRRGSVTKTVRKRKRQDVVFRADEFQSAKRVSGKKRSRAFVRKRLVDSSIHRMRLRHSNLTDWSANNPFNGYLRGQTFLSYFNGVDNNVNLTAMPVRLFNLSSTYQTATKVATPMWELIYDHVNNSYRWKTEYSRDSNGTLTNANWQLENNSAYGTNFGGIRDKGYLRWTRARFIFYGKQKQDTKIRVSIIKFKEDEYTPEVLRVTGAYTDPVGMEAKAMLDKICKPLINNPISSQIDNQGKTYTVLKTYEVNIDPTLNIENDTDVSRRQLDVFNRWDRMFTFRDYNKDVPTISALEDGNKFPVPVTEFDDCLTTPHKKSTGLYMLITSFQPTLRLNDVPNPEPPAPVTRIEDSTASFDWNIQSCWDALEA